MHPVLPVVFCGFELFDKRNIRPLNIQFQWLIRLTNPILIDISLRISSFTFGFFETGHEVPELEGQQVEIKAKQRKLNRRSKLCAHFGSER